MRRRFLPILAISFACSSIALTTSKAADLVYVTNFGNNTVTRYDSETGAQVAGDITTNLNSPSGIAFDSSGNMFVANYGNTTVSRFDKSGQNFAFANNFAVNYTITGASGAGNAHSPLGIAFDSSNQLYVAGSAQLQFYAVGVYTAAGAYASQLTLGGSTAPEGIAFDSSGNLWVSSWQANQVLRFSGSSIDFSLSGFSSPGGIAFAANDDLYVANATSGNIQRLTAASNYTTVETFASGLSSPRGIGFDNSGFLWVAEAGAGTVKKFSTGDGSTPLVTISANLNVPLFLAFQPVPEPSTYVLGTIAAAVVGVAARRRSGRKANA